MGLPFDPRVTDIIRECRRRQRREWMARNRAGAIAALAGFATAGALIWLQVWLP